MRILLDHCVPVDLASHIKGHDVVSVREMNWQDYSDGALLDAMTQKFDVLVTVDGGIKYQQLIADRPLAVVILSVRTNRIQHLARLIPALHRALKDIAPGEVREVYE